MSEFDSLFRPDSPVNTDPQPKSPGANAFNTKNLKDQTGTILDIISEGEIEGLVNGDASVFLDGTPLINEDAYLAIRDVRTYGSISASSSALVIPASAGADSDFSDTGRKIVVVGAGKSITGTISGEVGSRILIDSGSGFTSGDESGEFGNLRIAVRIPGAGIDGTEWGGFVTKFNSTSQLTISPALQTSVTGASIYFDLHTTISTYVSTTSLTLADNALTTVTDTNVYIFPKDILANSEGGYNFDKVLYEFMTGTQNQPVSRFITRASSLATGFNNEIQQHTDFGGSSSSIIKNATTDLSIVSPGEMDYLKLTIMSPSMFQQSLESGREHKSRAEFQIYFEYLQDGTWKNPITSSTIPIFGASNDQIINSPRGDGTSTNLNPGVNSFPGGSQEAEFSNNGFIINQTKTKFIRDFQFSLEQFKPFTDFRITIKRVTQDERKEGHYQHTHQTFLQGVFVGINDRLNFPHVAITGIRFLAQEFNSIPVRTYETKGIKIQVPTNYNPTTRTYTRNITTGINEASYQKWDGKFRGDWSDSTWKSDPTHVNYSKIYSNNPAWVYYDLLVNNRYGLGEFLTNNDIDKFQLYEIAKYCDELVPDGNGGTEPRFTCNIYITNKQEAQSLLSDIASIFRSILMWVGGKATPVQDRPKSPIYTFTKGNVINGDFVYQSSANRLRTNQVNVTWNNPDRGYIKQVEVVEDTDNILNTSRIISKDIVAMGATSQGQAHRLGKWVTLTERLEKSLISFKTSLNASFIVPGDIIYVQDKDQTGFTQSGRVSVTGTLNNTTIPLDRAVNLGTSGETYDLHLISPFGGAYLQENSSILDTTGTVELATTTLTGTGTKFIDELQQGRVVTINGTDYTIATVTSNTAAVTVGSGTEAASSSLTITRLRGDLITSADVDGTIIPISSEEDAGNILDTNNDNAKTYWNEESRVETNRVTTTGDGVSSLTVANPYKTVPNTEVIWALSRVDNINLAEEATKYRVISIIELSRNEFEISGHEYLDEKFDAVDRGYELYQRTFEALPNFSDVVPEPRNFVATFTPSGGSSPTQVNNEKSGSEQKVVFSWEPPLDGTTEEVYPFLNGFHIRHTITENGKFGGFLNIPAQSSSHEIYNIIPGNFKSQIRTVNNIGQVSKWVGIDMVFTDVEALSGTAVLAVTNRLSQGGNLGTTLSLNSSTGLLTLGSTGFTLVSPKGFTKDLTGISSTWDFSNLADGEDGYLLLDDSTSDFKMVQLHTDAVIENNAGTTIDFEYWKEIGAATNGLTLLSETPDITATETINSIVYATFKESFTASADISADFNPGDLVKLGAGADNVENVGDWYNYIREIDSTGTIIKTQSSVSKTFSTGSADNIYRQSFKPNFSLDYILLKVHRTNSTSYSLEPYAVTKGDIGSTGAQGDQGDTGSTGSTGVRGAASLTFEESTSTHITAANVDDWVGTLTDVAANNIAREVIVTINDGFIRTGDRITVSDTSDDQAGTRVYNGTSTSTYTDADAADFSSLVVEIFNGSVIVDGTLAANKITSGTISAGNITLGTDSHIKGGQTNYNTGEGFFLGYNSGGYKFSIGNAGGNSMTWDGSTLTIQGTIQADFADVTGGTKPEPNADVTGDHEADIDNDNITNAIRVLRQPGTPDAEFENSLTRWIDTSTPSEPIIKGWDVSLDTWVVDADPTIKNTAKDITGQGTLAKKNSVALDSGEVTGLLPTGSAATGLRNTGISITGGNTLSGGGGGVVTKAGVGLTNVEDGNHATILAKNHTGDLGGNPVSFHRNSNISINDGGSLTGAGSGSVTIGGLGFTGELDATDGAQAGTGGSGNLLNEASAKIGDDEILNTNPTNGGISILFANTQATNDTSGTFSREKRFSVPRAGGYRLTFQTRRDSGTPVIQAKYKVMQGGATIIAETDITWTSNTNTTTNLTLLDPTDTIDIYIHAGETSIGGILTAFVLNARIQMGVFSSHSVVQD